MRNVMLLVLALLVASAGAVEIKAWPTGQVLGPSQEMLYQVEVSDGTQTVVPDATPTFTWYSNNVADTSAEIEVSLLKPGLYGVQLVTPATGEAGMVWHLVGEAVVSEVTRTRPLDGGILERLKSR